MATRGRPLATRSRPVRAVGVVQAVLALLQLALAQCAHGRVAHLVPSTWLGGLELDRATLPWLAAVSTRRALRVAFLESCEQCTVTGNVAVEDGRGGAEMWWCLC